MSTTLVTLLPFASNCGPHDRTPLLPKRRSRVWPQHLAAILATLSGAAAGAVLGWSAPALPQLVLTETEAAWTASLAPLGALAAAVPSAWLADNIGRRNTLLWSAPIQLGGWVLLAVTPNYLPILFIGRFLLGVSTGMATLVAPLYCAEVAEARIRGALGVYLDLNMTIGILYAYAAGAVLDPRGLAIACAAVPLTFLLAFPWMPESPVFLAEHQRWTERTDSLKFLWGKAAIGAQLEAKNGDPEHAIDVPSVRPVVIVLGLMFFQQMSGINAILFYTVAILEEASTSASSFQLSPFGATVLVGAVQVAASALACGIVDHMGRRPLLGWSALVMSLSLVVMAAIPTTAHPAYPLVALCTYIFAYSVGFGPLPWLLMAELLPPAVRQTGSSAAIAVNWLMVFAVTNCFPLTASAIGLDTVYIVLAIICGVAALCVWCLLPETRGRSMRQIYEEMAAAGKLQLVR